MSNAYDEIARLSPEERTLLEQLMKEEGVDISHLPISRIIRKEDIPLSFSQERLWSLWNLAPENPSENVFVSFEIKGKINVNALENAVNEIVRRNEIFRTVCIQKEDGVYQQIHPELIIKIENYDFSKFGEDEKKAEAKKFIEKEISLPFDLTKLPIFRLILLKFDEDNFILTILTHQFLSDGYTANLLLQTISDYYNRLASQQSISTPKEEFDYADFSVWHRKRIEGKIGIKQLDYWKDKIKTMPTQLRFPTDKKFGSDSGKASSLSINLSAKVSDNIRTFSDKEGYSVFMIFLAGLQLALNKMTHQDKVLVTTSVSTRGTIETEKMFGNFSNNLLFCSDFTQKSTFKDILSKTRSEVGVAFENQDLPLEHLVSVLQKESSAFIIPRIQVLFMLRDKNSDDLFKLNGLATAKFPVDFQYSKLDLIFDIYTAKKEISINLTYKKDLFTQEIISEFSLILGKILSAIITKPANKISNLPQFRLAENYFQTELSETGKSVEYIAPLNETEKMLAEIWQKFFNKKQIGTRDNFFDLGGHSLMALAIFNELKLNYFKNISLVDLFNYPTISSLTKKLIDGVSDSESIDESKKRGEFRRTSRDRRIR